MRELFLLFQPIQLTEGDITSVRTMVVLLGITTVNLAALFVIAYVAGIGLRMGLGL
jgi:hypothetical protein